jgi:hypothetical protein
MTNACCCVVVTHNCVVVGLRHADVMKLFHSDDVSNRPATDMSRLATGPCCSKAISLSSKAAVSSCVILVALWSFGPVGSSVVVSSEN